MESATSALSGSTKPQLKDGLRVLEERGHLHPALRVAFDKMYAWTSDEDGVRHALMEESSLDFADAQFMLVACSASSISWWERRPTERTPNKQINLTAPLLGYPRGSLRNL